MRLAAVVSAILLCSLSLFAADKSIPGIPSPLEWRNKPADWHVEPNGDLAISASGPTDWFISPLDGTMKANSPVLLFKPAPDFVLSAKVTVDFRHQWDAGLLAVYVDKKTWAKLCFEITKDNKPTIVSVVTRGLSDDANSIPVAGDSVYLQIAKKGQALFFYASADGIQWTLIRSFSFGPANRPVRVGFSSQSPVGNLCTALFSQIRYQPSAPADFWTGQ